MINNLTDLLYAMTEFKIQTQMAHWNVTGESFPEHHAFFKELYEFADDNIDSVAEQIRALDSNVQFDLNKMGSTGNVKVDQSSDPKVLLNVTLSNINTIISQLNSCMKEANSENEFGVQNFIAGLIESHEKFRWMIRSQVKRDSVTLRDVMESMDPLLPGNYIDDEGNEHEGHENKFVVVTEDFPTIASFLEGNPIASEVVQKVMDLVFLGKVHEAEAYLEKHHQPIKDQVMTLVRLQPQVASKVALNQEQEEK